MIDGFLNTILLFISIWNPSILSLGYSALSLMMWYFNIRQFFLSGFIYKAVGIYSLLVFFSKALILTIYLINPNLSLFTHQDTYQLFGITLSHSLNFSAIMGFYTELVGLSVSLAGLLYRRRLRKNPKDLIKKSLMGIFVLVNLIILSLSYYTIMNTLYFIALGLWVSFWGYRVNERFLLLGMSILSFTSLVQIILSGFYSLILNDYISNDTAIFIGFLILTKDTPLCYFSTFFLFFSSSAFSRRLVVSGFSYAKNIKMKDILLGPNSELVESPSFFTVILNHLSFTLIYGVCVFNIFLWISNIHGYIQLVMMIWLFYSIIESDMKRLMFITRKLFIPLLIVDCVIIYAVNLFGIGIKEYRKEYSTVYVFYEILTISMFFLLQRRYKKKLKDSHVGSMNLNLIVGLLLEHSNKIALTIVFVIGLSKINLIHLGFMIIFLIFMLNSKISNQYWIVLIVYTQLDLMANYLYGMIVNLGYDSESDVLLNVIGIDKDVFSMVAKIFPNNYFVWMLLLSAAMQLSAYRSSYIKNRHSSSVGQGSNSKIISFFAKAYKLTLFLFIWIVYTALFFIINISSLNIINLIRYLILLFLFSLHVLNIQHPLIVNDKRVEKYWHVIIYYSGLVLVIRYLYQFFKFTSGAFQSEILGLQIYTNGELYENMVTDCVILLIVVYEQTRRNHLRIGAIIGEGGISVTDMIKEKSNKMNESYASVKEIGAKYFIYVYMIVIAVSAVFWRLSISMLLYIIAIGGYNIAVGRHIRMSIAKKEQKNLWVLMKYRTVLWTVLMVLTMMFLVISYCCFFVYDTLHNFNSTFSSTYFLLGFSEVTTQTLLSVNYLYIIIFVLLIIERHFIDGFLFERVPDPTPSNPKISLITKIIVECFLPSWMLGIAFYKLTIVSLLYVLAVAFSINASPLKRTTFLFYVAFIVSIGQYVVLLANLSNYDSPYRVPASYPEPFWKPINKDMTKDELTYLNLGNTIAQTYGLLGDLGIQWLLCIFFSLFAMAHSEISEILSTQEKNQKKQQLSFKEIIYSSTYFTVFVIVLLFVSESSGFFSLAYCIFCLIIIFLAIKILKTLASFQKFLKIIKYVLIPLMCSELVVQSLFQLPIHNHFSSYDEEWMNAIGLAQLWTANGSAPKDLDEKFRRIYFKSFTLGFILLVHWMMSTRDYAEFVSKLSVKYRIKAKQIGMQLATSFNDYRIKELNIQEGEFKRTENELKRLGDNVNKWNEKFNEFRSADLRSVNNLEIDQESKDDLAYKYAPKLKRTFQNFIMKRINPIIFKGYLYRMKRKKNKVVKEEHLSTGERYIIGSISSQISPEEKRIEDLILKYKKKQHPYVMNYRDWMKLLLYFVFSSTQGIVFIFFFVNHYIYASMESLIYPLSVFLYGMMAYPRPTPKYFRVMLIYSEIIFLIKFVLNLYIWNFVTLKFNDPAKIGFNKAENTYSQTVPAYIAFDAICMLTILVHEYVLTRCGLYEKTEIELESLSQAKIRKDAKQTKDEFQKGLLLSVHQSQKVSTKTKLKNFINNLIIGKSGEKPGTDYYSQTIFIQMMIFLFLLLFFPQIEGSAGIGQFVANSFPGSLVVCLIIQISIMLIERFLYLNATSRITKSESEQKSIKLKFLFHIVLVFTIHALIFWYFPLTANYNLTGSYYCTNPNNIDRCNNFQINPASKILYMLYLMYFTFSALQIKKGTPSSRAGEFVLMKKYNSTSNILFLIYKGLPFLYEIRTLIDWTFTATALSLIQWFKLEDIHSSLYNTKCDQLEFAEHPRGQKLGFLSKLFKGCCFLLGVLLIILAPLIIFSSLNPIIYSNPVKQISLSVGVRTKDSNFYPLSTITMIQKKDSVTMHDWNNKGFNEASKISISDREYMEKFTLGQFPNDYWQITSMSKTILCQSLVTDSSSVYIQIKYLFTRDYPASQQTVDSTQSAELQDEEIIALNSVICTNSSNQTFTKKGAFSRVIRLLSAGTSLDPLFISSSQLDTSIFMNLVTSNHGDYWEIGASNSTEPIVLYIISEKYSPVTFNFSVITFYISVVYVFGKILRVIISGGANNIPLSDMQNPDQLINLCRGIYISRMNNDLYKEEMLYYDLINILRSPELMKMISGSSAIKRKDE